MNPQLKLKKTYLRFNVSLDNQNLHIETKKTYKRKQHGYYYEKYMDKTCKKMRELKKSGKKFIKKPYPDCPYIPRHLRLQHKNIPKLINY
jgi:hypothetical protein